MSWEETQKYVFQFHNEAPKNLTIHEQCIIRGVNWNIGGSRLFWGLRGVLLGAEGTMALWEALASSLRQAERRLSSLWCLWELGRWSKHSSFSPRVWFIRTYSPSIGWTCPVPWRHDLRTEDGNFWNPFMLFQTLLYSAEMGKSQVALPNDALVQVWLSLNHFVWSPTLSCS